MHATATAIRRRCEGLVSFAKGLIMLIKHRESFLAVCEFAYSEMQTNPLTKLADRYGSDKGFRKHLYTRVYRDLFERCVPDVRSLLEIGLLCHEVQRARGTSSFAEAPSLSMWTEYLPSAAVYGFDLRDFSGATGDWAAIIQGDQSDREALGRVKALGVLFDVIIDDGLHASYHQQVSFSNLFERVRPGGAYIIEDLHYQPDPEESLHPVGKTLDYLRTLQRTGRWESPVATVEEKKHIEDHIGNVGFFDSMSHGIKGNCALAVITKRSDESAK